MRRRGPRAIATIVTAVALFANALVLGQQQEKMPAESPVGHNVPFGEPQPSLLGSNYTDKGKAIKSIIWVDDAAVLQPTGKHPTVSQLREAMGEALVSALAGEGGLDVGASRRAEGREGTTLTLSREVIPLIFQAEPSPASSSSSSSAPKVEAEMIDLAAMVKRQQDASTAPAAISYASASTTESYEESRPSFAFDGDANSLWVSRPWQQDAGGAEGGAEGRPQWIEYSFQTPRPVRSYSLSSYPAMEAGGSAMSKITVGSRAPNLARLGGAVYGGPTSFALRCSADGVTWTELHGVNGTNPWIPGEVRRFRVPRQHHGRQWNYCRVYIYAAPRRPDGTMQTAISEIAFVPPIATSAAGGQHNNQQQRRVKLRAVPQRTLAQAGDCSFPFEHGGQQHSACIPFQDQLWCKTSSEDWLVCDGRARLDTTSQAATGLGDDEVAEVVWNAGAEGAVGMQGSGPASHEAKAVEVGPRRCDFPFLHFGSLHHDCVSFEGSSWCKDHTGRWLTCAGQAGQGANSQPQGAEGGGFVLSVPQTDGPAGLSVLELKPITSQDASGRPAVDYEACKISSRGRDFSLYIPQRYTRLPLGDDEAAKVDFPPGFAFPFYGKDRAEMYVGTNGYITFEEADTSFMPSAEAHSSKPRISALFADVETAAGGEVQYGDLGTAVSVTWSNVTVNDDTLGRLPGQTFQTILFQDGTIWMGYGEAQQTNSTVVGVSSGAAGAMAEEEPLSSIPECAQGAGP